MTTRKLDGFFATVLLITLALALGVLWPVKADAQAPSAFPYTHPWIGDGTTVQFELACSNNSGLATLCGAGATSHYIGVCVSGCGTTGTNYIAFAGQVPVIMDGTSTKNDYVQLSATAGNGHDTGASTWPSAGGDVAGSITIASTGAGSRSQMEVFAPEQQANSAASTPTSTIWSSKGGTSNTTVGTFAVNTIKLSQFIVDVPALKISTIDFNISTPDNNGADLYDIGIYGPCNGGNTSCPLVTHVGATVGTTFSPSAGVKTLALTGAPVTITSGRYYIAWTCSAGCTAVLAGQTNAQYGYIAYATSSSSTSSGGVLPSTIIIPSDSMGLNGELQTLFF